MYDASGVRLHAGKQASVLNMIITELPPDHPVSDTRPLRDTLGHTPLQVRFSPTILTQIVAQHPTVIRAAAPPTLCRIPGRCATRSDTRRCRRASHEGLPQTCNKLKQEPPPTLYRIIGRCRRASLDHI